MYELASLRGPFTLAASESSDLGMHERFQKSSEACGATTNGGQTGTGRRSGMITW